MHICDKMFLLFASETVHIIKMEKSLVFNVRRGRNLNLTIKIGKTLNLTIKYYNTIKGQVKKQCTAEIFLLFACEPDLLRASEGHLIGWREEATPRHPKLLSLQRGQG